MIRSSEDYGTVLRQLQWLRENGGDSERVATVALELEAWEIAYGSGYAAGKDKAYFEIQARLDDPVPHMTDCGCEPCQVIGVVLEAQHPSDAISTALGRPGILPNAPD